MSLLSPTTEDVEATAATAEAAPESNLPAGPAEPVDGLLSEQLVEEVSIDGMCGVY